jgi:ABC-type multidrug transport system ATPase subunit
MNLPAIAAQPLLGSSPVASPGQSPPLVELIGVWRSWGRGRTRHEVLRGLDLEIAGGTATSVNGRNGAGKTTLLRIITGILAPDRGVVLVDGIRPEDNWREYHRGIGFLSAGDRGLYARVTVQGHLEHWTALALVPRRERKQRVQDALASFDLNALANRRADRLSQGQRQRLRLALTVVHRPKLLLLDEPRNSLDADGRALLAGTVRDVLRRGGAALCCSPAGEDQLHDCDRQAVIEDGMLRFV